MRTAEELEREERFARTRADWHQRFPPKPGYLGDGKWVPEPEQAPRGDLTRKQSRRWCAVTLEGTLALPAGTVKTFDVAAKLGKVMKADGTFDWITTVGHAACIVVSPVHRDRVLRELRLTKRTWERDVTAWVDVKMAHRCPDRHRGTVTLFLAPEEVCPACRRPL